MPTSKSKMPSSTAQEVWQELQSKWASKKPPTPSIVKIKDQEIKKTKTWTEMSLSEKKKHTVALLDNEQFEEALSAFDHGVPLTFKINGDEVYLQYLEYAWAPTIKKLFETQINLQTFEVSRHDAMLNVVLNRTQGDGPELVDFLLSQGIQPSTTFFKQVFSDMDHGLDIALWWIVEGLWKYPQQFKKTSLEATIFQAGIIDLIVAYYGDDEYSEGLSISETFLENLQTQAPKLLDKLASPEYALHFWQSVIGCRLGKKQIEARLISLLDKKIHPPLLVLDDNIESAKGVSWPTHALSTGAVEAFEFLMRSSRLKALFENDVKTLNWERAFSDLPVVGLNALQNAGFDFKQKDKLRNHLFHYIFLDDDTTLIPNQALWAWMIDNADFLLNAKNKQRKTCFATADKDFRIKPPGYSKEMTVEEFKVVLEREQLSQKIKASTSLPPSFKKRL